MAMVELYSQGWSKRLFVSLNTIPVRRGSPDRSALRDAVSRLHAGRAVGIFPEGGIRDGSASLLDSGRPQRGAALLARMTEARVLPCVILGSDRLYNRRRWRPGSRANVWISFGTPFEAPSDDEDFSRVLIAHIHALREDLLTHHKATAQDLPLPPRQRMNEP
jgi:1-acyl-sn-glycerol-3-phosphate acyltransferase